LVEKVAAFVMYTEHVKAKLKSAFAIFEQKDTAGYVYKREVPTIIRSSGLNPRENLMSDIMKEVHSKDIEAEVISFDNLEKILTFVLKERLNEVIRDSKETIMRAFMAFDKQGLGYLNVEEFKEILESTGDQFTEEERRDFLATAVDKETGNIDYEQYARLLAEDGRAI
jgi:Ca2+-binding EF-hand superfamily protein